MTFDFNRMVYKSLPHQKNITTVYRNKDSVLFVPWYVGNNDYLAKLKRSRLMYGWAMIPNR